MLKNRNSSASVALALLLAAGTALLYSQAGTFDFIPGDDGSYVFANPVVRQGLTWRGLWWAITSLEQANWHPLTWVSHLCDVQIFGMNPGAHHRVNVVIHAANAGLLLVVLSGLTGARWRSALVAALFAVHPLHVESVAWVAERKDLLAGFFFILTVAVYGWQARRPRERSIGWVAFCLALGLMSKPMLVTLPLLLVLLDHWPLGRLWAGGGTRAYLRALRPMFLEKLPLLALSLVASAITLVAQTRVRAVYALGAVSLEERLSSTAVSYGAYLDKALWPARLASFYPYPRSGYPPWQLWLSVLPLVVVTVVAWRVRRRQPHLLVGWLWFLGMLIPVIGLVQVGMQAMADRYTYLPLVGVFIGAVWCVPASWVRPGTPRLLAASLALAALGTLSAATRLQALTWRSGVALYRHALAVTPDNALTQWRIGQVLAEQGSLDEAVMHLRESVRIAPDADQAISMGLLLEKHGQPVQALEFLRAAISIAPRYPFARFMMGLVLTRCGAYEEAAASFREAIALDPGFVEAHYQLGLSLAQAGRLEGAVRVLSQPNVLTSDFSAQAHYNLGVVLEQLGRREEAEVHYRKAEGRK